MELSGRGVLLTGASRGLGAALALELSRRGAKLALVARKRGPLEEVVAKIRSQGGEAHAVPGDVADKQAAHRIVGAATAQVGPIDLLVHNASALGPSPLRLLLDTECEELESALATNLVGPFRITKAVAGSMAVRGTGLIVQISSDAAFNAYPSWGAYGASKIAADHLTRVLAAELSDSGVRALSIDPGDMDTQLHREALPDADPSTLQRPAEVAAKLARLIDQAERIPSGSRIELSSWRGEG